MHYPNTFAFQKKTAMKIKILLSIVMLLFINAVKINAQQNLFNIPSGDVTPNKKVFFQQQINVNAINLYAAKSHFVYGLGKGWEIGANVVNMNVDFSNGSKLLFSTPFNSKPPYPYYPVGLITAQKRWDINEHWFTNLGTQMGSNLAKEIDGKRFTHFSYALGGYHKHHSYKFVGGLYATDWRMVGGGNNVGYLMGTEIHLNKKWLFMADHISGNNKNSVSVIGFTYNVNKQFQLCAGWQIPNANSSEKQALVLEINLFNF